MLNPEQSLIMAVLLIRQVRFRKDAYGTGHHTILEKESQHSGCIGILNIRHLNNSLIIMGI